MLLTNNQTTISNTVKKKVNATTKRKPGQQKKNMIKHQHNASTCVKYSIEKRKTAKKKGENICRL